MRDLRRPGLMWLKAILFLCIGSASAAMVWAENRNLRTALLLAVVVWSFCRAYYFAFYVLEKYVDPEFRFAGLWSMARYIAQAGKRKR